MAEDWDLFAVVRSCCTTSSEIIGSNDVSDNPLDCLAALTFDDGEEDPFSFPNLVSEPRNNNVLQELQDSYKPFLGTSTTTVQGIIPTASTPSTISDFGGLLLFNGQDQPPAPPSNNIAISPRFTNNSQQQHLHQQQLHDQQIGASTSTVLPLRTMQPRASRSRMKKSHQKRLVVHVPAENLSSDEWAWRKYGQKPIKGSPYPRNYYRCSSSKGCAARKQVERSNTDPNVFIVSYTGDHTHPRPTHRNCLAGGTRNKFLAIQKQPNDAPILPEDKASCSSPPGSAANNSSSATTPVPPMDHAAGNHQYLNTETATDHRTASRTDNSVEGADVEGDGDDHDDDDYINDDDDDDDDDEDEDEDDDILIPNIALSQDLIKGLQEL